MEFEYPSFPKITTVDVYHGHKVADPYRWLEDAFADETKSFVEAQNNVTIPYLKSYPDREKLKKRLTELWNYRKYETPIKAGNYYFFKMNKGLQNQSVMYKLRHLDGEPEVFFDPNELSTEGLISMTKHQFSEDGQYMAYLLSESGSDWNKIKIRNASTHEDLPDLVTDVKYSAVTWTHDNKGFFYSRCPNENHDDGRATTQHKFSKLYYHKLGTDESEDVCCVEFPDKPTWMPLAKVSECGRYVFIVIAESCKNNLVYYSDLEALPNGITGPLPLTCLIDKFEAEYEYVTNDGPLVIFHTDRNAPLHRLIIINLEKPDEANWIEVIPEDSKNVLEWAKCVNENKLLCCYIEDVKSVLCVCDMRNGERLHTFPLDVGHVNAAFGKRKSSEIFFTFTSFMTPGIINYCNLKEGFQTKIFREMVVPNFDMSQFEMQQVFYRTKDGTKIPMFIVQKKGAVNDGSAPVLMYGYGGFNNCMLPYFNIFRLIFIQHFGGILAYPNIRGGGEYGKEWHAAGIKFNKQNTFDDFIAAAEYLIEQKYTCARKLIINGASNGGLLVAACANQRPELFGCVIAQVGVMDLLRYHTFTIGHAWKSDYCCADDDEEQFKYLMKISPLHNVKVPEDDNVQYPATLLMTADHDDRVPPLHSLKFIAVLQEKLGNCEKQKNPLMVKIDTQSGHGHGKPTCKLIAESNDIYCFICNSMGIKFQD